MTASSSHNDRSTVQERVLEQIKEHRVTMVPRAYFMLRAIAAIFLIVVIFFLSVAILNYILFSVRASHHLPLLSMGIHGLGMFILFFPWFLLFFDLLSVIILQRILRSFTFGYRTPLLYVIGTNLITVACFAGFLDYLRTGDFILHNGYRYHIPILSTMYGGAHDTENPDHGICPCVVIATSTNVVTLEERHPDGTTRIVHAILPPSVGTTSLSIGENVFLVGTYDRNLFYATDMHTWDPDSDDDSDTPPKNPPSAHQ